MGTVPGLVRKLAASRAGAVVLVGMHVPATEATLAELGRRKPGVPVLGTAGLAGSRLPVGPWPAEVRAVTQLLPAPAQAHSGRRMLATIAARWHGRRPCTGSRRCGWCSARSTTLVRTAAA